MIEYQEEKRITARAERGNPHSTSVLPPFKFNLFNPPPREEISNISPGGKHLRKVREDLITLNQQSRIDLCGLEVAKHVIKSQSNLLRLRSALKLRVGLKATDKPRTPITFLTP
jgi:hypothetical protein